MQARRKMQIYFDAISLWNNEKWNEAAEKFKEYLRDNPEDYKSLMHCVTAASATENYIDPIVTVDERNYDDWIYIYSLTNNVFEHLQSFPVVLPSMFWQDFANAHLRMIAKYGAKNFKRTVGHNYYNWMIYDRSDPIFIGITRRWAKYGQLADLNTQATPPSHEGWDNFNLPYPLHNLGNYEIYRQFVSMAWGLAMAHDPYKILLSAQESLIGAPLDIRLDNKIISTDLAASAIERAQLMQQGYDPNDPEITVVELGAGHGRLAELILKTTKWRYVIIDIPPALAISSWYLTRAIDDVRIFHWRPFDSYQDIAVDIEKARLSFLSGDQIRHLPDDFCNIFINIASLMEMTEEQVAFYIQNISRITKEMFFSKQWEDRKNQANKTHYNSDTYKPPGEWSNQLSIDDHLIEGLSVNIWKKTASTA